MSTFRVGDRVVTADELQDVRWPSNVLSCRKPGHQGIVKGIGVSGCYLVEHDGMLDNGSVGRYLGDELTPIRVAAPSPEWVQLEELNSRLTALEQCMAGQDEDEIPDEPAPPPSDAAATIMQLRGRVEELQRLYDRLAAPEAYDVADPDALANVALAARESVQRLTAHADDLVADATEGIRERLAELVPGSSGDEPLSDLLAWIEPRVLAIRDLCSVPPEDLRAVSHGLACLASDDGATVARALYDLADTLYDLADAEDPSADDDDDEQDDDEAPTPPASPR